MKDSTLFVNEGYPVYGNAGNVSIPPPILCRRFEYVSHLIPDRILCSDKEAERLI
jgi:hypothetical protein